MPTTFCEVEIIFGGVEMASDNFVSARYGVVAFRVIRLENFKIK